MKEQLCILIDIGGTAIKSGTATSDGNFLNRSEIPTEAKISGGPGIVAKVHSIIKESLSLYGSRITGVAVSTAGMVDPLSCEIVYALPDAIPNYTGINFKTIIKEAYGLPCCVENDVNCAALGELFKGAGRGLSSIFCMTIGTSIGGAMIVDSKLVSGSSHSAGEIAYMQIPGGMLHELASTTALVRNYADRLKVPFETINGRIIFDRAEAGDELAQAAIAALVDHLSYGIVNVVSVQNPQAVILGGGIMAREAYLRPLLEKKMQALLRPIVFEATRLEFAKLKNDAGMLGALYNFKTRSSLM